MSLSQTSLKCGHISQTCNNGGEKSIMLFGVQLTEGTNTTTTNNNNNLSQYQQPPPQVFTSTNASNVSDNVVHAFAGSNRSKQGNWTEEEHKRFLKGLKKFGKGKWTKISSDFVKTRTPTQVASHAQKHYLLRSNQIRRRNRKSSVFDLTIDTEVESSTIMEDDEQIQQATVVPQPPPTASAYPSTHNGGIPDNPLPMGLGRVALPVLPLSWVDLNGNRFFSYTETFPLSLKLQSLPPYDDHSLKSSGHHHHRLHRRYNIIRRD